MGRTQKIVCLFWFALHFLFIVMVSCRDTFDILSRGGNLVPRYLDKRWYQAQSGASVILGEHLDNSNSLRQALAAYMQSAGIEAGYAFFAPNVPNSYKLVFELHYPGGRIEYALPEVHGHAAGMRFTSLFDYMGSISYVALREFMLKMLAQAVWREHKAATTVRAVFGIIQQPGMDESAHGRRESYQFLYAYDFRFHGEELDATAP